MPAGLEDVSKYPDLLDRLKALNSTRWNDINLGKLAGMNLIRVFQDAEAVRDSLINEEPYQHWISFDDLNAVGDEVWRCRTLLNNSSPISV